MKKVWIFIKSNYKIIVPIIIMAVPFIIFIYSLISASFSSNKVILGNRYRNDLDPQIEVASLDEIKSSISSVSNVESVEVVLKTSQLRVLVDIKDSVAKEDYEQILTDIYNKIDSILSIKTYFTKNSNGKKMYDLEITAYNDMNKDDDLIMYSFVKNSTMDEPIINLVSEPKDPELVEELKLKEQQASEGVDDTPETTPQFEEELEEETQVGTEEAAAE